ncbi:YbfB/YjiJ family MFS transporter [Brevibacterium sp. 50QC2O2]|uniref:YbfB/YjiJ family MFS transporter n=1 Tax=Brevibacterium sp. 50QC2O2 TaxID=2968459 RepID=UPI00211CEB81|nr:YbfB/YjiJ family MFS transporter [Brevibacterium sp. 50QC2O2]MCQ9389844.1 YbfB/YjiJ family MFS transporter [Brevibacterium sp. 50QC2O2]
MTHPTPPVPSTEAAAPSRGELTRQIVWIAAGFAAALGLARFVYTPLLPLMTTQAGLSEQAGAQIATANYLGYMLGAGLTMLVPRSGDNRHLYRLCLILLVASEAAMALVPAAGSLLFGSSAGGTAGAASTAVAEATPAGPAAAGFATLTVWWIIRLLAGFCSGIVFIHCSRSVGGSPRLGLAFVGIGAGILLSGLLTAICMFADLGWAGQWIAATVVTGLVAALAWHGSRTPRKLTGASGPANGGTTVQQTDPSDILPSPRGHLLSKGALTVSYLGEGIGYIIIGTFIVAALSASLGAGAASGGAASGTHGGAGPAGGAGAAGSGLPDWLQAVPVGNLVWMVAGLAAIVSIPCLTALRARFHVHTLLLAFLGLQIFAAVVPACFPGVVGDLVGAVLFGGTFVAIVQLTLAYGVELRIRNSAAVLVTVYSVGQILGPLLVAHAVAGGVQGYRVAFTIAAAIIIVSTLAAALARPRRLKEHTDSHAKSHGKS